MKLPILILATIGTLTTAIAQKPRIETTKDGRTETYSYRRGGDSLRLTILGTNDTVEIASFYRNGKTSAKVWEQDSVVAFDYAGRPMLKYYGLVKLATRPENNESFYTNGQIRASKIFKDGKSLNKYYAKDGRLMRTDSRINGNLFNSFTLTDENGVVIESNRMDTVFEGKIDVSYSHDTVFYPNGRVFKVENRRNFEQESVFYYKEDGTLLKAELPNAVANLIVFKDNVDCFYGLKNAKGDTIVKPRFDRIDAQNDFFVAFVGETAMLLDKKGAPMTPPVDLINGVSRIGPHFEQSFGDYSEEKVSKRNYDVKDDSKAYYSFESRGKYGVMTEKAASVMPPQHYKPNEYFRDVAYFNGVQTNRDSAYRNVILNRKGELVFPNQSMEEFSNFEDYFILKKDIENTAQENLSLDKVKSESTLDAQDDAIVLALNKTALGNVYSGIVLQRKFKDFYHIKNTSIFATQQFKKLANSDKFSTVSGLYDVRKKRWLLDTMVFFIDNESGSEGIFVVKNLNTKKMGIMDTTGAYVLPVAYDSVGVANVQQGLFWVKKDKRYQILTLNQGKPTIHKPKYDYLESFTFTDGWFDTKEKITHFIAKQKGKWGLVDASDKIVMPFEYDYASKEDGDIRHFILVKNGQAAKFNLSSIPNEASWQNEFKIFEGETPKNSGYPLIDNPLRVFIANDTGKILVPPQYKMISEAGGEGYGFLEDDQKNKKLFFTETGEIIDYPFRFSLWAADAKSRVMVVSDTMKNSIGVVSTAGKVVIPCNNYAVTLSDFDASVFFVKRDTPILKEVGYLNFRDYASNMSRHELDEEDVNWRMFDGNGKELSSKPFRFAIRFKNGVGIGMQDAGFNLYKNDGTILTPFRKKDAEKGVYTEGSPRNNSAAAKAVESYLNIRRQAPDDNYALFYNVGLTPTMVLTKNNGEIIVEGGRYDGISRFYGKYALVTAANKVGLIDSSGREIIAPQDLRTYKGHFGDSLNVVNAAFDKKVEEFGYPMSNSVQVPQPLNFGQIGNKQTTHPDNLSISPALRTVLWNLLLEKTFEQTIMTASDVKIEHLLSSINNRRFQNIADEQRYAFATPSNYSIEDNSCAFVLKESELYRSPTTQFYNFYLKNNRWEDLKLNDLLLIQGDNRWKMNDLITKKVKALKDQQIDCSNAAAFIKTVEDRWQLTREGINFCFDSSADSYGFVVISFTWAELSPFLKFKIYAN